jgi:citrate lyase beta subunit
LWTNDPERAAWADASGVDRIGLDLETLGKANRQSGLPTWISPHRTEDLSRLKTAVRKAQLFVRVNPLHPGSADEVERLVGEGVEVIMLPNFTEVKTVDAFLSLVNGRALVVPLLERLAAVEAIEELAELGFEEIHVGLNDLSIDLGLKNRLAALAMPIMDEIASRARAAELRLGLGGLGRVDDVDLPGPSDLVYAQHARLGASGALLARSFFTPQMTAVEFDAELRKLRARLREWQAAPRARLEQARSALEAATRIELEEG